ncbi:MAG: hypothetical protein CBC35_03415 [Planctomycetes bacterium TMED75]|nr:hypothetical protein [Planctomycetaceae bacterium]OUU94763.1 MAG: hypothetical protein CBC35_03415 [Planctomycetes bacterium TMED75]
MIRNHPPQTFKSILLAVGISAALASSGHAQHAGDIALRQVDGQLEVYGPLGSDEDTDGVFLATFGDTGFAGLTPNPGFDAVSDTFEPGRIGFDAVSGLQRWDPDSGAWLAPSEVGESLSISFITLECVVEDGPITGFDLAVQPDGGWHRHMNFVLMGDDFGNRTAGVYRVDYILYSTMGYADSEVFTILYDYDALPEDVENALDSMYENPGCLGDFDGNGAVDGGDLTQILASWGTNDPQADLSEDGVVAGEDLTILLGRWGQCSEP